MKRALLAGLGILLLLLGCAGTPPGGTDAPGGADAAPLVDAPPGCECAPGQSESRACGACDSGSESRACDPASCAWSAWSGCAGEETGYPTSPATGAAVCPPYARPAVYFAAHADDEAIGMAASIAEHVAAGRDVFVELMTHGEASIARAVLANGATDPWHPGSHSYALTPAELGDARIRELLDACARLGVKGVFVSDFGDGNLLAAEVATRVSWWIARVPAADLSLKGTAGPDDPREPGGTPHPDHAAVWEALVSSGHGDVRGYLIYHYGHGAGTPDRIDDTSAWCAIKGSALDAYEVWDPPAGRYAIGYHSVASLIDAARADCREFVVYP